MTDSKNEPHSGTGKRLRRKHEDKPTSKQPSLNTPTAAPPDFTPIQPIIDQIASPQTPIEHNSTADFLQFSMEREQAIVKFMAEATEPAKPGYGEWVPIQSVIDSKVIPTESTKQNSWLDLLTISSLLSGLVNFYELTSKRWPGITPVMAAELSPIRADGDLVKTKTYDPPPIFPPGYQFIPLHEVYFGVTQKEITFLKAIEEKNLTAVRSLLKNTDIVKKINTPNAEGFPLITLSVKNRDLAIAKELIKAGADINALTLTEDSTLTLAAGHPNLTLLEFLLQHKANLFHKNAQGQTALTIVNKVLDQTPASPNHSSRRKQIKACKLFLEHYELYAHLGSRLFDKKKKDGEILALFQKITLKQRKKFLNSLFGGHNPFLEAIQSNRTAIVEKFIAWGANINLQASNGHERLMTPLLMAISKGNLNTTKLLLAKEANPNLAADGYKPPIILATHNLLYDTIEELLKHNVNLYVKTSSAITGYHYSLLDMALERKSLSLAKTLVKNGIKPTIMSFIPAINSNDTAIIQYLIDLKFVDINQRFSYSQYHGYTPVRLAAEVGFYPIFAALADAGADLRDKRIRQDFLATYRKKQSEKQEPSSWPSLNEILALGCVALFIFFAVRYVVNVEINTDNTKSKPPQGAKNKREATRKEKPKNIEPPKENEQLTLQKKAKILAQKKKDVKEYCKTIDKQLESSSRKFQRLAEEYPKSALAKKLASDLKSLANAGEEIQAKLSTLNDDNLAEFSTEFELYCQQTKNRFTKLDEQYKSILTEITALQLINDLRIAHQRKLKEFSPTLAEKKSITTADLPICATITNLSNPTDLPLSRETVLDAKKRTDELTEIKNSLEELEKNINQLTKNSTLDEIGKLNKDLNNLDVISIKEQLLNANVFIALAGLPEITPPDTKKDSMPIFLDNSEEVLNSLGQQNRSVGSDRKEAKDKKPATTFSPSLRAAKRREEGSSYKKTSQPTENKQPQTERSSYAIKTGRLLTVLEAAVAVISEIMPLLSGPKEYFFKNYPQLCRQAMLGLILFIGKDLFNVLRDQPVGRQGFSMHININHYPGLIDGISRPPEVLAAFKLFFKALQSFKGSGSQKPNSEDQSVFAKLSKNPIFEKLLLPRDPKQKPDKSTYIPSKEGFGFVALRQNFEDSRKRIMLQTITPEITLMTELAYNYLMAISNGQYDPRAVNTAVVKFNLLNPHISLKIERRHGNYLRHLNDYNYLGCGYIEGLSLDFQRLVDTATDFDLKSSKQPVEPSASVRTSVGSWSGSPTCSGSRSCDSTDSATTSQQPQQKP